MRKFILATCLLLGSMAPSYAQLTVEAVQEQITQKKAVLIDVRTPSEYAQGHLEQSHLLPYEQVGTGISSLTEDKSQLIYVYCRSGRRSDIAKSTLESLGYTNVHNLGGYEQLKAAGLK